MQQRLRGLALSAVELRELTTWPAAVVEDYLNIIDNLAQISTTVDTGASIDITTITANYTTMGDDGTLLIDCSSNPVTVSLDITAPRGQEHTLKCIDDTYDCIVDASPNSIDDDGVDFQLFKDESIVVRADENNDWWII